MSGSNVESSAIPDSLIKDQTQLLLEAPLDAIMIVDAEARIQLVNRQLLTIFGYEREQLIGQDFDFLLPHRFRRQHREHIQRFIKNPIARPMGEGLKLLALHSSGREFPVEIGLNPLQTDEGLRVAAAIRDISKQHATEAQVSRLGRILETSSNEIYLFDAQTLCFVFVNQTAQEHLGYELDEIEKLTPLDIFQNFDVNGFEVLLNRLRLGEECLEFSSQLSRSDGSRYPVAVNLQYFEEESSPVFMAMVTDTSDRKRVLEALISAQENERGRISRDLHDQVGQALTALILGLSSAQTVEDCSHLKALAIATLEDVRRISRDLRPALLDELGLEAAIKRFCRELAETKGFKVDVLVRTPEELHQDIEIVIYRVVQEALTNVIRHAEASHASVVVTQHEATIQIIIEDNGHGFDPASPVINDHLGLAGMRERLELFGGSLTIESTLRKGTTVSGRLPMVQDH